MKKTYCPVCNAYRKTRLISKEEIFNVKGEDIKIMSKVLVCSRCNGEVFDEEIEEKNLELAYDKYRKKNNLFFPKEIKEVREKYGLSQRALGRLLGWGGITINRYEQGCIQDNAHNDLLELIREPQNMLKIYEKNKHLLSPGRRVSLEKIIHKFLSRDYDPKDIKVMTIKHDNRKFDWTLSGGSNTCQTLPLLGERIDFYWNLEVAV